MIRFFILFLPLFLFAHKINLFLDLQNDNLYISSYFGNGKPCINCPFVVKDEKDNIVLEDTLNRSGEYNYKTDLKNIVVTVNAGAGHVATQNISADENIEESDNEIVVDDEIAKLKLENSALKREIELLKHKLDYLEIFKVAFGVLIILAVFLFLKRVKS